MTADLSIRGVTGLKQYSGIVAEEFLRDLDGAKGIKVYKEMSENDAVIGAILFAIEMLVRQVTWSVEAASNDREAKADAAFLEECMTDTSHTWEDFIAEVLTMLTYGWAYFEIVYKLRKGDSRDPRHKSQFSDDRIGWRKFSIRAQETLYKWEFDEEGGIQGMWQQPPTSGEIVLIPIDKALLFRTTARKNSPQGRSVLRSAYRSWWFLKRIQEIEAVGIERDLAGLPVLQVPEVLLTNAATDAQKQLLEDLKTMVQEIRRDEREGLIVPCERNADDKPTGYKFELLSTGSRRQFDTNAIITRYEQRIAMTVLADFIMLGIQNVGSFALASSKTHLFGVALGAWLDSIAAVLNRFAVPRLFALNGMKRDRLPRIVHGDVSAPSLGELADFIFKLSGAGVEFFPDERLESYLRNAAKMPPKLDDTL